jgi:hypothetical protein
VIGYKRQPLTPGGEKTVSVINPKLRFFNSQNRRIASFRMAVWFDFWRERVLGFASTLS